jgi:hypothetical protein
VSEKGVVRRAFVRARRKLLSAALVGFTGLLCVVVTPAPTASAQGDAAEELAELYAPVVRLRAQAEPCGDGEPYQPVRADAVLDNAAVALRGPWISDDLIGVGPGASDLGAGLTGYHLDFPGEALSPGCDYERWSRQISNGVPASVYARVVNDGSRPGAIALQYWFFYVYNDFNNKHEGDWEMIQLVFDAENVDAAVGTSPALVGYSQHSGAERAEWGSDKLEIVDGTHPVVYPAEGSHANFFSSALYLGRSSDTGVGCDDTTGEHLELRPEVAVIPTEPDDYLAAYPWLGFEGHWGERQESFYNGPTGPNMKQQWTAPIVWSEQTWRDESVTVPLGPALGPNVSEIFCDVVETGSDWLRTLVREPVPFLIALAVLAVLIVVAAVRTSWSPGDPHPIVQRRAAGRLFVAARRMYRLHWRLFAGIGLVYVPVMLVAVGLQWLLVDATGLNSLADPDGDQHAWAAFLALLLGGILSLFAYFTVLAAVSRVLADIAEGRPASLGAAYREVRRHARSLAAVAVFLVVVVGLLLIPLVTAPLAVLFAVRYGFAVQAVMVEERGPASALRRSRELVQGSWWRVALVAALVVGIGAATGALAGIVLLLISSASFGVINLVAAAVYVATMPYVALVLAYLFFDLSVRAESTEPEQPVVVGVR